MASAPHRPDPNDPDAVAAATFSVVRRGWDPDEVRAVLRDVAAALREARQKGDSAPSASAAAPDGLDDDTLVARLGEETARVLRTAREGAAAVTARAEEGAARLLRDAQDEATRVREEAAEDARQQREQASADAADELEKAKAQGREMVAEARSVRERMLTDLSRRRDAARGQLERLDAVRERIAGAFAAARASLDEAMAGVEESFHVSAEPIEIPAAVAEDEIAAEPVHESRPEPHPTTGEPVEAFVEVVVVETAQPVVFEVVEELVVVEQGPAEPAADADEEGEEDEPSAITARDLALEPVITSFTRQLKRVLADEQNAVLDALRRTSRIGSLEDLVGTPDEHAAPYVGAAATSLVSAVELGAENGERPVDAGALVATLTPSVVDELVAPLRVRLEEGLARSGGDNLEAASVLRAAYREWKTQRLDPLATDLALAAHGAGAFASLRPGTRICWVLDPDASPCSDADDNVLGGVVAAGEPFPTGHLHAPAHAGCRCLLQMADG